MLTTAQLSALRRDHPDRTWRVGDHVMVPVAYGLRLRGARDMATVHLDADDVTALSGEAK